MSAQPVEPADSPDTPISALEEALRRALATAKREQVIFCIASTLPIEIDTGPDSTLYGAQSGSASSSSKAQKVSVSMPADLVDLVRARTGAGGFSRYVTDAVQLQFNHDLLGDLLDELEEEFGQVPAEVREQTRRMWPDQAAE
jgi:hypothetical protein